MASSSYRELAGLTTEQIEVTALHPLMVDETGAPAFGQRAPHLGHHKLPTVLPGSRVTVTRERHIDV